MEDGRKILPLPSGEREFARRTRKSMTARFITSSGTGIGKTLVTAALAWQLRARGREARAIKPVISGYAPETAARSDSGILLAALGREVTEEAVAAISPWRFAAPLAPDLAAAREGRTLDLAHVVEFCRDAAAARGDAVLLIEGVGGVMAPMTRDETVADWMAALGIPAILVVGSYLGAISHALTAAEALSARAIPLAAVVVSESEASPVTLDDTIDSMGRFLPDTRLIALPRLGGPAAPWRAAPDLLGALEAGW